MISKKILNPDRVRRIDGGFSFIPHQFLTDGFLDSLQPQELTLYVFLILAADRHGLSYYSYERICTLWIFPKKVDTVKRKVSPFVFHIHKDTNTPV